MSEALRGRRVRTLLRVSSRQQLHDDDIPVQRAEAERYISERPDWVFDREYIEKAVSAYRNNVEEREVLQEILSDARDHQFDVLLTYMSDRIGRQEEYSFYVATLNQLGIEVWTIKDGQLKTREHTDKLLNYIRFWQNEGESKKTGMRVRDTQREMIKAGKFVGGKAPYGYQLVPSGLVSNHGRLLKRLEVVEEKAQVVRQIFDLAVYQGMGYEKIAGELNKQGIPTIMTDKWKPGTVRNILTNPVYSGYLTRGRRADYDGCVSQGRGEWICSDKQIPELIVVSRQLWEKAQEIREARKAKIFAARKKNQMSYEKQHNIPFSTGGKLILTGLVYCGYCGKGLKNGSYCNHWRTKSGEEKTACVGRYICPSGCRERSCYSQSYLEGIVSEVVEGCLERLRGEDLTVELQKMYIQKRQRTEKELESVQKKKKALQLDIRTLEEKVPEAIRGNYFFSAERLSSIIEEKEREEKELCLRARQLEAELSEVAGPGSHRESETAVPPDWKTEFRGADTRTGKMLLFSLIERMEVRDEEIHMKFKIGREVFRI